MVVAVKYYIYYVASAALCNRFVRRSVYWPGSLYAVFAIVLLIISSWSRSIMGSIGSPPWGGPKLSECPKLNLALIFVMENHFKRNFTTKSIPSKFLTSDVPMS